MTFVEHNNRKKANKFAEYITSPVLRKYLADKVKQYCGDNVSVFDGAALNLKQQVLLFNSEPEHLTVVSVKGLTCLLLTKRKSTQSNKKLL